MLKAGKNSSEFWGLIIFAGLVIAGLISPEQAKDAVATGASPVESITNVIKDLAESKGDLALYAGILWAYIKRRSSLKSQALRKGGETGDA